MVMGSTSAPDSRMAVSTRSRASGSTKRTTQPPPPAPQTLPASAPLRRGAVDNAVDGLRRDRGQISLAEGPLFLHQAASFGPVGFFECQAHLLSDVGNALQAVLHGELAADVRLVDFPVVYAVLARFPGIADHHTALEFVQVHAQFNAMLTAGWEFDGSGAAEGRRVVILGSGGHIDDDGFGVAADVDPIDLALARSGEAVKCS